MQIDFGGKHKFMELRAYLRILLDRWWIVLLAFVVTYATTLALTFLQPERFQAKATFVVGSTDATANSRDNASVIGTLAARPEIPETFAAMADSTLM